MLAPEKPFPNGLVDYISAYFYLLNEGIPREQNIIAGDSSGGNLTIVTLLYLSKHYALIDRMPMAAIALSPWLDFDQLYSIFRFESTI